VKALRPFLPASALLAILLVALPPAVSQTGPRPAGKFTPKLEPIAETKLLMEGLANPNFRGMEKLLKQKPGDAQAWTFLRGQALLVAETGNLLMLRPPRNPGQSPWMERATDLRNQAVRLAQSAGREDYDGCKTGLTNLANACNRCHESFKVPVRIVPFGEPVQKVQARPGRF
jgi:hypothetical protein